MLKAYGFRCKKCGAKLNLAKFKVDVKKIDGSFS